MGVYLRGPGIGPVRTGWRLSGGHHHCHDCHHHSGCGPVFGFIFGLALIIGLAMEYPWVVIPLIVLFVVLCFWGAVKSSQHQPPQPPQQPLSPEDAPTKPLPVVPPAPRDWTQE